MARPTEISRDLSNRERNLELDLPNEGVIPWERFQKQRRRSGARCPDERAIPRIVCYGWDASTSSTSPNTVSLKRVSQMCDDDGKTIYRCFISRYCVLLQDGQCDSGLAICSKSSAKKILRILDLR